MWYNYNMATKKTSKRPYRLIISFNGMTFTKQTADIAGAILSLTPETLYTEVFITIKHGKEVLERKLNLKQGKNLFVNEEYMPIFINNLLLN